MGASPVALISYVLLSHALTGARIPQPDATTKMLDVYSATLAGCCANLSMPVSEKEPLNRLKSPPNGQQLERPGYWLFPTIGTIYVLGNKHSQHYLAETVAVQRVHNRFLIGRLLLR